jgi:capsular polysaccharide biosynthesis protein
LSDIWRAEKLDNDSPPTPAVTESSLLDIVRSLRDDVARHEQLLGQVMALIEPSGLSLPGWLPKESGGAVELSHAPKIHHVENPQGKPQDILSQLQASGLGKFYVHHLKQYPFVHGSAIWMWRNLYPVYVNHFAVHFRHIKAWRWLHLTKLSEFAKTREIPSFQVTDAALVETPVPTVFPVCDQDYLASPHDCYNFPPIYVAKISDGMVYGGTNLVLTKDEVICHDLYDFERDYTSEELHGRSLIGPGKGRIRWLVRDGSPECLPAAAAFVDACASNYAHWLTEVLPRIAVFCAEEQFKGIPIVVNDDLHKNIMESLSLVVGAEREIVTLPIGRALQVDALYLTSVAGYVPFDRRNNKLDGHSHGLFSPPAFELIRRQVASFVGKLPEQYWPEKIYLRRNSGVRKLANAVELEKLLVAQGYEIVEVERFTFLQQVQLFENAKEIISPTGAAISNAIFCKPGTRLGILMAKHENMIYRYWLNMLAPLHIDIAYVLGAVIENHDLGIHADFSVDGSNVIELLKSWRTK